MNFICLIPARYASTRFPGKPLAKLGGKLVIQHVYERAQASFETVYVCTDDERIYQAVADFGGKSVMTSSTHRSGTERCNEAYSKLGINADVIVNIQGDEPFIHPSQLEALKNCFTDSSIEIATLVKPAGSIFLRLKFHQLNVFPIQCLCIAFLLSVQAEHYAVDPRWSETS